MRLQQPRIAPVDVSNLTDDQKEILAPMMANGPVLNIFRTMVNAPKAAKGFLAWGNYVLSRRNELPAREREIVILRIGYLCKAGYEWGQHVQVARGYGMSDDEIRSAKTGPSTPGLSELDRLLLQATDELHADAFVSDATWNALAKHLSTEQLMDMVFTVGQYNLVSMALNRSST